MKSIERQLNSKKPKRKLKAIQNLKFLSSNQFLQNICSALNNNNPDIIRETMKMLKNIVELTQNDAIRKALFELLRNENSEIRQSSVKLLSTMFKADEFYKNLTITHLCESLFDDNYNVRMAAMRFLRDTFFDHHEITISYYLIDNIDKFDPELKLSALKTINEIVKSKKHSEIVKYILNILTDNKIQNHMSIIDTLKYVKDSRVVEPLLSISKNKNIPIESRIGALLAITKYHDNRIPKALIVFANKTLNKIAK